MKRYLALLLLGLAVCASPTAPDKPTIDAAPQTPTLVAERPPSTPEEADIIRQAYVLASQRSLPTPPPTVDPRTPAQIMADACTGPKGEWLCRADLRPKTFRFGGTTPIIPTSQTVPDWYIDTANSVGCALDSNTGTSATCVGGCSGAACPSGQGPLLTYQELAVHRWTTYSPRLRQNTTLHFLSNSSGTSDPIYFYPYVENGAFVSIQGALGAAQQVATGTLSNVTAKNQANGVGTPLLAQSGATGVGQLVVNTQAGKSSRAWTYVLSGGSIFKMDQPLVPAAIPVTTVAPAEVNSWGNGDTITVYNPVSVNLAGVGAILTDWNAGLTNILTIYQVSVAAPVANDTLQITGGMIYFVESQINRIINILPEATTLGSAFINCDIPAIFHGAGQTSQQLAVASGALRGAAGDCVSCSLQRGITIGANINIYGTTSYNDIFIDSGKTLTEQFGISSVLASAVVWGLGTLNVAGNSRWAYTTGAGGAAAALPVSTLLTNGKTVGCLGIPSAASAYATCNTAVTAANLDGSLGATSGCIGTPNGGAFCNY